MLRIAAVTLALLVLAVPAALADPGGKHGNRPAERERAGESDLGSVIISAAERALIREYYQQHPASIETLPPGIAKKVARGKPLPPGIAKKFPAGLHGRLPARPGYSYRTVGADVVLVEMATGVIVDLVKDILR